MPKPEIHNGTSKVCKVTVKNEYGKIEPKIAQFNDVDKQWKEKSSGEVIKGVRTFEEIEL